MKNTTKKKIRRVIHTISTLVLVGSLAFIGYTGYQIFNQNQVDIKTKEIAGDTGNKEEIFVPDLAALQGINRGVNGYIYWPTLDISYPILQSIDNDYYLNKDIYGNYSEFGSIFMDYKNNPNFSDRNNVIYGHSVFGWSGMFTGIHQLTQKTNFDTNNKFIIYTPNQNYRCEVFAFFGGVPDMELYKTEFNTRKEFNEWLQKVETSATYLNDSVRVGNKDKIVMLSTCSSRHGNGRYLVFAKMVPDNNITSKDVQ